MSEPTPPSSNDDPQLGAIPEQELDEILSRASTLAGDVVQEVGAPDVTPGAAPTPQPAELSGTLDDELRRLDGLVSSAATEVGAEPSTPASKDASSDATRADSSSAADRAVPNFMLEFTEPAPEPPPTKAEKKIPSTPPSSSTPQAPPAAATRTMASKPGLVGTGMLGVISTAESTAAKPNPGGVAEAPQNSADQPAEAVGKRNRLAGLLLAVVAVGVRLLELLDRPFGRLGHGIRDLVGWIALATLGTALVVYLIAVL